MMLAALIAASFLQQQLAEPRVREAFERHEAAAKALFQAQDVPYPPSQILLRAFKQERELELWARRDKGFVLVKTYPICAKSGGPGPKRHEGDGQVPEGFYVISGFNPRSQFHLSLRVSYPNASDRILGKKPLGGDVFVHGNCVTIGCMPITDPQIEELYVIAVASKDFGKAEIPLESYPAHMTAAATSALTAEHPAQADFWANLKEGYDWFEHQRVPSKVSVDAKGRYHFAK
jgi:murein L,D-transpeptidase YafK